MGCWASPLSRTHSRLARRGVVGREAQPHSPPPQGSERRAGCPQSRGSRPLPALAGCCRGRQVHGTALLLRHVPAMPAGTCPHTLTRRRPVLASFPQSPPPTDTTCSYTHMCVHIHVVTGRMRPHPPHAKAPHLPGHPKPRCQISLRQLPRPPHGTSVSLSTHMARDLLTVSILTKVPSALHLVMGNCLPPETAVRMGSRVCGSHSVVPGTHRQTLKKRDSVS